MPGNWKVTLTQRNLTLAMRNERETKGMLRLNPRLVQLGVARDNCEDMPPRPLRYSTTGYLKLARDNLQAINNKVIKTRVLRNQTKTESRAKFVF